MGNSPKAPPHSWKRLKNLSFGGKHCGRTPIVINNEIIVSPELTNKLYTFNINSTIWSQNEFGEYNNIWFQSLCISNDRKHIYLYDGHNANVLLIIDITTKMVIKRINMIKKTGIWPSILTDPENNNILHIIGGSNNNSHFTINIDNGERENIHIFKEVNHLCGGGIVYLRKKNVALLFHGDIPVYLYKFKDRKYQNTKIKFPVYECKQFGYVITEDNKYILIFGGGRRKDNHWIFSDGIFIFDVNQMCFIKSKMKCPKFYNINAAITKSGYVHLFYSRYHWVKHISNILPEYDVYYDEKNDDQEKQQNIKQIIMEWQCAVCTFLNVWGNEQCIMCNIGKRPDINSISKDQKEEKNEIEMELNSNNNNNIEVVKNWLKNEVNLPQYVPLFIDEGYDEMMTIQTMTDNDLMDIGINKKGHRKKLIIFINKLKNRNDCNNHNDVGKVEGANIQDTAQ